MSKAEIERTATEFIRLILQHQPNVLDGQFLANGASAMKAGKSIARLYKTLCEELAKQQPPV